MLWKFLAVACLRFAENGPKHYCLHDKVQRDVEYPPPLRVPIRLPNQKPFDVLFDITQVKRRSDPLMCHSVGQLTSHFHGKLLNCTNRDLLPDWKITTLENALLMVRTWLSKNVEVKLPSKHEKIVAESATDIQRRPLTSSEHLIVTVVARPFNDVNCAAEGLQENYRLLRAVQSRVFWS